MQSSGHGSIVIMTNITRTGGEEIILGIRAKNTYNIKNACLDLLAGFGDTYEREELKQALIIVSQEKRKLTIPRNYTLHVNTE